MGLSSNIVILRIPSWGWHQLQHLPSCHHQPEQNACKLNDPLTSLKPQVWQQQQLVDELTQSSWVSKWLGQSKQSNYIIIHPKLIKWGKNKHTSGGKCK